MVSTNCHITSGFSGLPKLRLSTTAWGRAPATATLRAASGMAVWLVGPEHGTDFAASAYARVVLDAHGGRPAPAEPETARRVVTHAVRLAAAAPVLHDVSAGGLVVALAEICIRSGVGVTVATEDWRLLLDESPHRLLVVAPPELDLGIDDVPWRRLGTMGGDRIDLGGCGSVALATAARVWREAIPRRVGT